VTSHDRARRLLLAERSSLRCLLTGLDYDPSANGRDEGDLAMANERTESVSREIERTLNHIGDIDAALARLAAGTYGVCDSCSRPVSAARLKVLPTATKCIRCAMATEYRPAIVRTLDVEEE